MNNTNSKNSIDTKILPENTSDVKINCYEIKNNYFECLKKDNDDHCNDIFANYMNCYIEQGNKDKYKNK